MKNLLTPEFLSKKNGQSGFTLIELVMVIVILGILAVVAIPKYQNMKADAAIAQADGVFGAAQSAAAINFSNRIIDSTRGSAITTGATLLGAMDDTPDGWAASGATIAATISGTTYTITVSSAETATAKAKLTKSW